MKKLLILANNDVGLYKFRKELLEALVHEYEVYVSLPDGKFIDDLVKLGCNYINTEIDRRGMNPIKDIKLMTHYRKIFKKVSPDIVLTYTIKPNIYGNYIAKQYKVPVMMNITGLGTSLMSSRLKNIVQLMYKYASSKADIIFFQNESNRNFFLSHNMATESKTNLIPGSGVNIDKFKPQIKKQTKNIKFLFIGRLMEEKGIQEYIEAAAMISKNNHDVEFQILGPFEEEKFKEIITEIKNININYLGISDDVREEIQKADCIVNPSYHEGMSNVLLEGAAMGKPLLASNIPGCKEIIDNKKNGFLFKPQSAEALKLAMINFLNLTNKERKEMGKKSREKVVKEFDRQIVVDNYLEIIQKILEE